jgi:2-polyprenyl-6-hydroxyphenyl methylase/3-demethylubiquinone-9 3-methyltransferase
MAEKFGKSASLDQAEIAHFAKLAAHWWDPEGPWATLHRLNPTRIAFVRDRTCSHFDRNPKAPKPLKGLRLLDLGCGGGILAEPMARLGALVVGADPTADGLAVARRHAAEAGLEIDYRIGTAESLAEAGEVFDIVLAMEVIEHVADRASFFGALGRLAKPKGLLFLSTLNRTLKSYLLAIVGAEYVLGWIPRGTHDWNKFVKPHEMARLMRESGFALTALNGMVYDLWRDRWQLGPDTGVNYLAMAVRE